MGSFAFIFHFKYMKKLILISLIFCEYINFLDRFGVVLHCQMKLG